MTSIKSDESVSNQQSSPEQLLNLMTMAGLSQPQARVYLELVKVKESTAGDLCKATGVRDSRIYSILNELEQIGLIVVQTSSPKLYMVIPLTEGLHNLEERLEKDFDGKKEAIKELNLRLTPLFDSFVSIPSAIAFIIKGKKNVINKIYYELNNVEKEILIRFPGYELYFEIEPVLLELKKAGIVVNAGLCQRSIKRLREESKQVPELPLHVCKQCCDCFYLMIDQNYLLSVSNWNSTHVYAIWTSDTSLLNITSFFSDTNVM